MQGLTLTGYANFTPLPPSPYAGISLVRFDTGHDEDTMKNSMEGEKSRIVMITQSGERD